MGKIMLKSSDVHCDMKIQFCTSESPNINHPSMLMAILNVEQARSSNVKRDQPNPKFAGNWHFTEFFRICKHGHRY
jgi:hypothetical protein